MASKKAEAWFHVDPAKPALAPTAPRDAAGQGGTTQEGKFLPKRLRP
ncbi:hypothetical protein L0337_28630 [candidate division KSB1 bacterium]|nr:hypothetical protein [candidate division KSB1 bacterium]